MIVKAQAKRKGDLRHRKHFKSLFRYICQLRAKVLNGCQQYLCATLQLLKVSPFFYCVRTFPARSEYHRRDASRREQRRIHPSRGPSNTNFMSKYFFSLTAYNPHNGFILGYLKWLAHQPRSQCSFEMGIGAARLINQLLHLCFDIELAGDRPTLQTQHTALGIARKLLPALNQ